MLKRIVPLVAVLSLLVAMFVVPASAATVNGRTVIDYNDYVSNVKVDGDNDIVTVSLPAYMYGYQKNDSTGTEFIEGVPLGSLSCDPTDSINDAAGLYFPGGLITSTFMDLSNIPDASVFETSGKVWIEFDHTGSNFVDVGYWTSINFYDSSFQFLGVQRTPTRGVQYTEGAYVFDFEYDVAINKPEGAVYAVTSFIFEVLRTEITNAFTIWFDFDIPTLQMSINSLYRLQEQTGKTNKLLDQIANGEVTPETPDGAGSVGDLDDVEGSLEDDTAAGRQEADHIFNESWGLVAAHMSGFLFLSNVIERMIGVGWLRGLIVVSLSLGILGFIANIAMIMGRNGRDGKDAKSSSGKGG